MVRHMGVGKRHSIRHAGLLPSVAKAQIRQMACLGGFHHSRQLSADFVQPSHPDAEQADFPPVGGFQARRRLQRGPHCRTISIPHPAKHRKRSPELPEMREADDTAGGQTWPKRLQRLLELLGLPEVQWDKECGGEINCNVVVTRLRDYIISYYVITQLLPNLSCAPFTSERSPLRLFPDFRRILTLKEIFCTFAA